MTDTGWRGERRGKEKKKQGCGIAILLIFTKLLFLNSHQFDGLDIKMPEEEGWSK